MTRVFPEPAPGTSIEKALYEVRYELNHRPSWAPIPLDGILRMLDLLG